MDNGEGTEGSLEESFLNSGNQYIVQPEDNEEGAVGAEPDGGEEVRDMEPLRDQDRFLPIANVARIMKKSIPKTGKIAKDAKECVQECVSEFVSFITSEASDRCHQEKRKTINGEDILFAMSTLGFDSYVDPLKLYLQKYREAMKGDKTVVYQPDDVAMEGISMDDSLSGQTATSILTGVTGGDANCTQPNVIYTSTYPSQLTQQLQFTT